MAFETLQGMHRPESMPASVQEPASGKVAKIMGAQVGQQRQPYIGGRGPVRDDAAVRFLKVVGRQPVVFGGYKLLEKSPGLPCGFMKERQFLFCQMGPVVCPGFAQAPDEGGGQEP